MPPVAVAAQSTSLLLLPTCRMRNLHLPKHDATLGVDSDAVLTACPARQRTKLAATDSAAWLNWQHSLPVFAASLICCCTASLAALPSIRGCPCPNYCPCPCCCRSCVSSFIAPFIVMHFYYYSYDCCDLSGILVLLFHLQAFLREKLRGKCRQAINFIVIYA